MLIILKNICKDSKRIDSIITVNDVTEILYKCLFGMEKWCKGITVYRDGCRTGVLLTGKENNNKLDNKFKPTTAFKRPKDVPCDVYFPKVKDDQYIVMVGILDENPYEVFSYKLDDQKINTSIKSGILSKRKAGWYNLLSDDKKRY